MKKDKNFSSKILIIAIAVILVIFGVFFYVKFSEQQKIAKINTFEECVKAGLPIMESYPPRCRVNSKTFTQDIGNELKFFDEIQVSIPRPNQKISSPIIITGKARGSWFFEGRLSASIYDEISNHLGDVDLVARGDWMSQDFVPFSGESSYTNPKTAKGKIVVKNANPSGLKENEKELIIPVSFSINE